MKKQKRKQRVRKKSNAGKKPEKRIGARVLKEKDILRPDEIFLSGEKIQPWKVEKAIKEALKYKDVLRIEDVNLRSDVDFSDEEKVLWVALENEVRGKELYLLYAKAVKSTVAKRVFIYLAKEELRHIADIKSYIKSMKLGYHPKVDAIIESGSLDRTRTFFGWLVTDLKEQIKPTDDDNKSREIAMMIEKAGYEYYRKGANATKNWRLKKFFKWLMREEQTHYMLIRNAFEYANNPDSWYTGTEHWLLEG
jgi:rubrerythrin